MSLGPEDDAAAEASASALAHGHLPPVAAARLADLARRGTWTSDLSSDAHTAVRSVGFHPVGQVMGSTVDQLGWAGWGGCGYGGYGGYGGGWGGRGWGGAVGGIGGGLFGGGAYSGLPGTMGGGIAGGTRSAGGPLRRGNVAGTGGSAGSSWVGFPGRVQALYAARRRAIDRLVTECRALGADGVVDVTLTVAPFPGQQNTLEFQALGTAVRSAGGVHLDQPFTCDLTGQDFARLVRAGWMPAAFVMGVAIGVRHDDWITQRSRSAWTTTEIPGYTELVHAVRDQVRDEIAADTARHGGEGLVVAGSTLNVWERPCTYGNEQHDHVAEAVTFGTAIVPFRRTRAQPGIAPLPILRLDEGHRAVVSRRLAERSTTERHRST